MKVLIVGAGSVGLSIAHELIAHHHTVTVIDQDPGTQQQAPQGISDWIVADACELTTLDSAELDTCDVVVSATGDDKANLVVSLLVKTEYGVPRTVSRVNNPKNEWLFDEAWGVDVAVSTPRLMTALVEEAVEVGDIVRVLTFQQGATSLVEFTVPETAKVVGKPQGAIEWPADTSLLAVVRDGRPLDPSPDTAIEGRDELFFLAIPEAETPLRNLLS